MISTFPHLRIVASYCPRCRNPVLSIDRGVSGTPAAAEVEMADRVDLSPVPVRFDVTPHDCPALGIVSQAQADRTRAEAGPGDFSEKWEVPS